MVLFNIVLIKLKSRTTMDSVHYFCIFHSLNIKDNKNFKPRIEFDHGQWAHSLCDNFPKMDRLLDKSRK